MTEAPTRRKSTKRKVEPKKEAPKKEVAIESPEYDLSGLSFLEMGILFYLKNYGLRKVPEEKRQGLMRARFDEAEKKLKAIGFIEE